MMVFIGTVNDAAVTRLPRIVRLPVMTLVRPTALSSSAGRSQHLGHQVADLQ